MPCKKNYLIYALFVILITYTAYTFLWMHFGLGVTSVVQLVLLGLVILGFFAYLASPSSGKNSWINWLFAVWVTQALAYTLGASSSTTQFKESMFVLLCAAPIISQQYNPKYAKYFMLVMGAVSIAMYFVTISMLRLEEENSYGGGYMTLVAFPVLLYFFRHKSVRTRMIISIIIFVLVLSSMKRGDILACILVILVYYYIMLRHNGKIDSKVIVALIFVVFAGFLTFKYMLSTSDIFALRFERTMEGDSSARDDIYSSLINYFLIAPLDVQLFGGGFDASVKISGARAHSDILEVLSCEGIFGLIIYLGAFFCLFRQMRRRTDVAEKAILASVLAIWLVKMVFSMFIFSQPTIILFVLTGYILNKRIDKQYEY
mgnify:FL=1